MTDILAAALAWHDAGACVLPAAGDGTKMPALAWKPYQHEPPTGTQLRDWFGPGGAEGLGIICGQVSGNLEMLELEGRAVTEGALAHIAEIVGPAGLAEVWQRITTGGYAEHTPSGGLHLIYRVDGEDVPGNTKLARRPATDAELVEKPGEKLKVLAETRGEGGWTVIAPSAGPTHPTGRPWTAVYGGPDTVPVITAAERHLIHQVIRTLDRVPVVDPPAERPHLQVVRAEGDVSPGDDFEARVDWSDALLLGGAGWRVLSGRSGGYRTWKRPGKDDPGLSATTGRADDRDRLYVFSSSTEFEQEVPYTKFGAYVLLHHGRDYSAAAKELRRLGYGSPLPPLSPDPYASQQAAIHDLMPTGAYRIVGTAALAPAPETVPEASAFGPTEDGMALALVAHYGNELRYCPERGSWLRWDGHRWAWDARERHREHVKELARSLPDSERAELRAFKKRALSANGITGIARLAQTDQQVAVSYADLDSDPWSLNTPQGVIDLRTGKTSPPDPARLHTRSTLCHADPGADRTAWTEFLDVTFGGDQRLIAYLQRLIGYSAMGYVGPHVLPFCHGDGGNGKGVFLEVIAGVLGDYATTAPVGFLMAQAHPGHETEIARLAGARMVICSEVNENDSFDEAKVKQLTGGDTLTARFMRADHFSFTPTHHLWLMGNHKPAVRSGGHSFWRRLRLVPFLHKVPEDEIVEDLQGLLIREYGPAVLAWIAEGAADFHAGGLREPDAVKAATAGYAKEQDTVTQFVEERCHIGGGASVQIKASAVREAYEQWCYAQGERPVSAKTLSTTLKARFGVDLTRTMAARFYVGVTLLADSEGEPEAEKSW